MHTDVWAMIRTGNTTAHTRCTTLVGVKSDTLNLGTRAETDDGMAKLVEADSKQLERVDDVL